MEYKAQIIINIHCSDRAGLVHAITHILLQYKLNIISLQEHVDREDNEFFSRIQCESFGEPPTSKKLQNEISAALYKVLPQHTHISIQDVGKKNAVIMVSNEYHCLSEIILRCKYDTMPVHILAVIGNHDNNLKELCEFAKVPFYYVPSPKELPRKEHESQIQEILSQFPAIDYIVLARYMRILSKEFIEPYANKIINIHHSFLPAFVGANPYRQAYQRGVKLIGATAHFVTERLDEGPIIAQQVLPITHTSPIKNLHTIGRNIEKITLANAIELVFDDRVFVHRNKTIIL